NSKGDISTLHKRGHFNFGLTRKFSVAAVRWTPLVPDGRARMMPCFSVVNPPPTDTRSLGQLIEDRTSWPLVAMTGRDQDLDRVLHRHHLAHSALQVGDVGQSDASDIGARPVTVLPELEQLGDLVHAKAEV